MSKRFPRKRKPNDDGLVDVPPGIELVDCYYRGKTYHMPFWLHPSYIDVDDFGVNEDEFMTFVHTGKVLKKRLDFENKFAP